MNLLNKRVSPPILTHAEPTKKLTQFSKNYYIDPEDNEYFDEADLTPIERGHLYLWKYNEFEGVDVYTPYRIMDKEESGSLRNLKSFTALPPYITGRNAPERRRKDPKFCLQNFCLTTKDFAEFREVSSKLGFVLEKDEVNYEEFLVDSKELIQSIVGLYQNVSTFREDNCLLTGLDNLHSEEELSTLMSDMNSFEKSEKELIELYKEIVKKLDKLKKDPSRSKAEVTIATSSFEKAQTRKEAYFPLALERMSRELLHKYKVKCGEPVGFPDYVKSLAIEIAELSVHYPVLKLITVDNESISIEIASVKIKVKADRSVFIDGDLTALKPYLEGSKIGKGKAPSRRERTIFSENSET